VVRKAKFFKSEAVPYWALIVFLNLTFLTGGASRADVQSLTILRPAATLFCAIGLLTLKWEHVKAYRFLFCMAASMFALVGSHLVPLPPSIWGALPGREIITEIDRVAELGEVWRPVSMVPSATWNALFALFVPLAVLILGVQLSREDRFKLLPWVLGLGMFSGFIGILQTIGDPQGPLYFYNVTNNGAAVGLFSNRNHQAILLASLFPMLAVFACASIKSEDQAKVRAYLALAGGAVLIPLLLVTGSRAGLIVGLVGLAATMLLYRKPTILVPKKRKGNRLDLRWLFGAFAVLCLGALTFVMSRAEALQRITAADQSEDMRFRAWSPIAKMAWKYFPFGSGVGSFVEVYQIDEPYDLLKPTYMNHAHNDWLEVYMTTGLPGLIILAIAVGAFVTTAWTVFLTKTDGRRSISYQRLGATILVIFAIGSIGDYPLRTPTLACLLAVSILWLAEDRAESAKITGS
jgi:O-antigen ligase